MTPSLFTPTARVRRPGLSLDRLLLQEYLSRHGCPPTGTTWHGEPWVGPFLRVLEGTQPQEPETTAQPGGIS